jgi:hypothetical protein
MWKWKDGRRVIYRIYFNAALLYKTSVPPPDCPHTPFGIPARGMNGAPINYYNNYFADFPSGFPSDFGAKSFYIYVSY